MSEGTIVALIVALSGTGGIVAGYRALQDKRRGAQDATMAGFQSVIDTLREEVDRLKSDRSDDRARLERVEQQITVERDLRWSAIQYVRILLAWVALHIPDASPPSVPHDLADHVTPYRKDSQ